MPDIVVRKPTNEELVYMSMTELEEYAASINDLEQLRKVKVVAEYKLLTLKILEKGE